MGAIDPPSRAPLPSDAPSLSGDDGDAVGGAAVPVKGTNVGARVGDNVGTRVGVKVGGNVGARDVGARVGAYLE
jgi:hypothetical protein